MFGARLCARRTAGHGGRRQAAGLQKLIGVRDKLAETAQQIDAIIDEDAED